MGGPSGQMSSKTVTVHFATSKGTAASPSDFTAMHGTLSFAPGQTVKNVVVPIVNDSAKEAAEHFSVNLTSPVNATVSDSLGVVTIGANDSGKVAQPRISAGADVTVGEGQGYVDVPVKLSHPGRSEVTVQYF